MKSVFKCDLIIFDLDGTLIDSSGDIAWAAKRTLESMGYGPLDTGTVKASIGSGVVSLLSSLMPGEGPESIERARRAFLELYSTRLTVETRLYEGVEETLGFFREKGKLMAIVTNKPIGLTNGIVGALKIGGFFKMVLGGDSLVTKKPRPEPVLKVLGELDSTASGAVFVGDSAIDCEAGRNAGVRTIGAAYGFRGTEELERAGCEFIINTFAELREVLK